MANIPDPRHKAAYDQHLAHVGDTVVGLHWRLYQGYVEAGFTEAQALLLVQTHIAASSITTLHIQQPPTTPTPTGDQQ